MALSRIWAAFIIVSIFAACYKWLDWGDHDVFSRMVVGKADDVYGYSMTGRVNVPGVSQDSFIRKMSAAAFVLKNKATDSKYLFTNDPALDSNNIFRKQNSALIVMAYGQALKRIQKPVDGIIETCWSSVSIALKLIGIMALFMGLMSIAEKAGGISLLSRIIGPFFTKLFPDIPKGHPAMGQMMMNFSANLLGLDNAATPFGLKTMESLQEINPNKAVASNAQIMFLCLHACGPTLIPVTIIAVRASAGATNPTDIFIPCMIVTFASTLAAMCIVSLKQKINLFQPVILLWVLSISALIVLLVKYLVTLDSISLQSVSSLLSNGLILLIFLLIILGALYKRIDIFDAFIVGAKGGFETAVKIIPYLVGMLVAISMLRASGTFDIIIDGIKNLVSWLGMDTRFVEGLPTALVRPLSASGARGMLVSTMTTYGADSFPGRLSSVMQGSSDSTFYVIALYFGAVGIKNTRYSVGAMLLADLVGIITAILVAYLFFG
ncbi:MAG TPA: nucleoside recognition domain-containing protein [Chitinophagaceae bacterium]|jgi:spore maturation protein SpmA/spore maturation protein SpmB